jgi:HD-GYP domain-containing protein (c-di-GMP phosphodiesterase class II)
MARKQLGRTAELAMMIQGMVTDESNLEEWVESKITKAQDYLTSVMNYMRGDQLSEDMASRDDIAALRQQVGNMSYEIERMLVALMKAGYSMEDIMQMASELRKMDPHPADVQVAERKLSKAEEKEKEKVVKGMKKSKKDFEKRYGDDAESVMYATATKMAKEKKD